MTMHIQFIRYATNEHATASLVFIDGVFFCHGLEDQKQEVKVRGETRIPAGVYEVKFRLVMSPKTERYRALFPWFTYHLQLQNVPGFDYIYIHVGNDDDDTEGCLLVGDSINNLTIDRGFLGSSTNAFKRVYLLVKEALNAGERVFVEVADNV